jgi:hypothetical protein
MGIGNSKGGKEGNEGNEGRIERDGFQRIGDMTERGGKASHIRLLAEINSGIVDQQRLSISLKNIKS